MKVYKDNIVMTINENEFSYYKKQGFKEVGKEEVVEKTISLSKHESLIEKKDIEIKKINDELSKSNEDLNVANKTIKELQKQLQKQLKNNEEK